MSAQQITTLPDLGPVFRSLPGWYIALSPEFTILEVTDAYLQARHTSRDQLQGKSLIKTFEGCSVLLNTPPTQALEQSLQHVLFANQKHHISTFCYSLKLPEALGGNYKECYWSVTNSPILDDKGNLLYILHEARELSEKNGTAQANEQITVLNNALDAVSWEYDPVLNKMEWGPGLQQILGYTPEEMGPGGESWDERVHPDDFEAVQASIEKANATGSKIWTGEYRFRKADGTYIPVLDQGYIIYHSDGRPLRTLGSIIDLSEHKKSQEELKESDMRFRHLLEVLPHMAWMADAHGKVIYFNKNWYSYTGMTPDQTEGWTSVIHPEDTAIVLMEWHNTLAAGAPYEIEYRLHNYHDKSYRWFLERGVPMYSSDGKLQFWIGTLSDIDDQKQVMERIREKDLQLENILNHSPVHFCQLQGPEHVCTYITPGISLFFGNRQYLNRTVRDIWHELKHTEFFNILDEVYRTGNKIKTQEYKLIADRMRNGQTAEIYLNLEYRPLIKNDRVEGILVSAVDVTELVKTKQRMAYNEYSLRLLSKAAGCATWECDVPRKTITWSESYKELFGYSDSDLEAESSTWDRNIHPDDYKTIRESIDATIAKGQRTWTGEYRFRKADGSYTSVLDHGFIVYNSQGKPEHMLGSLVDITRQKKHELALQYNSERFKRIAMATNDVLWDWNLQDDTIWWNEGYTTLFGYQVIPHDLPIDSWTSNIHPDDLNRVKASIHQVIDSDTNTWEDEYRFKCADGSYKLIHDKGHVLRNTDGKGIRMFGSMLDVTEKRRIEQQLHESNARTHEILESLPLMTWTATPDGKVNYYNQRWYDYTGNTYAELISWADIIHPEDMEHTIRLWEEAIQKGKPFETENRWRSAADGVYRWFLARAVPIRNSEGEITMWVGSHTEIEDQKQAMLALEESTNKFRFLTESSPQVVWSANPDGNIDYTSKQWLDYTQMTLEDSLGYGWAPAIHPDDLPVLMELWAESITTGKLFYVEVRVCNVKTKEYQWFLIKAQPLRNEKEEIIKWYGVGLNINELKELQEQLQESEQQFRFLTESIPQMVWTATPDGATDYFNKRWINYTGLSFEESVGPDAWLLALHPDDHKMAFERWQYSVRTGEYYELEYRIRNGQNGPYRWFLGQGIPMRDAEGNIVRWFGTCTDIEDHKKAEEELVEKNLELERINQDLDSFVYAASHDLKLPIVNMAGIFKELTQSVEFTDPDAPKLVSLFNKSLDQIHNTIVDLSDVVKMQKHKTRDNELVDLDKLTEDVKLSIQDVLHNTGASITTDFSEVPSLAFSKANLKSIVYNLLSNAIKYRKPNQKPAVFLSTTRKGDYVELKVQDNGIGIDMNKHQNKLFQMFKRFHNHVSGSGLGLYIVNRLLTNSGGYITIESTLNEGTTFLLYFKQKNA
ncbi:PAS domain-containing protein [Pontibacter populi]|uniref:histidine kinase n=1 Tax=Pontibacter populi TaxID=890055 RepID=A0ABV1RUF3_9BACT